VDGGYLAIVELGIVDLVAILLDDLSDELFLL
jgi:hypothetical protein